MNNRPKPDDRRDNVEKIQQDITNTIINYRETKDLINKVDNEKERNDLIEKNQRREQSIKGKREEIRDEALARKNGYK
ncbi:MAG: small acid-soluble spore protein Tlp [Tissierellia bacterium]|nr:small acid-soluble spore protein Tlp [Tissierellia bacterium]